MAQKKLGGLNIFYRENTADESVLSHSFENDIYLSSLKGFIPSPGNTIIDVGAHIGSFSIYLASLCEDINIFAIEASKSTFEFLQKNIEENRLNKIKTFNYALSERNGRIKLYHDIKSGNWGHSISKKISDSYEEVNSISLTNFIERNGIVSCDLIKFNCEGAEFKILQSTDQKLLSKVFKRMIILYHEDLSEISSYKSLKKHLKKSNFVVTLLFKEKERGWIIAHNKKSVPYLEIWQEKLYNLNLKRKKVISKLFVKIPIIL